MQTIIKVWSYILVLSILAISSCATSKNIDIEYDDLYYSPSNKAVEQNDDKAKVYKQDSFLNDTSNKGIIKPALRIKGTKVYKENTLLKKNEVLNILSSSPTAAKKYEKGTDTRSTGTLLIVSGAVFFVGGIALAVTGVETKTTDGSYYSYSYTDFNRDYYIGLIISTLGGLMVDGGIACSIVGKITIKRAISNFNASIKPSGYAPGYIPGLMNYQVGLLDNGNIGLRITF